MERVLGCRACHPNEGNGATHIDGILQASGGTCNACHGYGPSLADGKAERAIEGKGAHEKHVNHLVAVRALTVAGFALNPNTDQFGAGDSWTYVCGVCHNGASHNMGEAVGGTGRTIAIPASYQFGAAAAVYNGAVGVSSCYHPEDLLEGELSLHRYPCLVGVLRWA